MPPKKKPGKGSSGDEEHLTRIAIVNAEKCKPKKCRQECKKSCPVVKLGKLCIEVGPKSKIAFISEPLCIGKVILFLHVPLSRHQSLHRLPRGCMSRCVFDSSIHSHTFRSFSFRLWYLCQKVSLRCYSHYQLTKGSGEEHCSPLRTKFIQAASLANASSSTSAWFGGNQRYWKVYGAQDSGRKNEAKLGTVRLSSGLGGNSRSLSWFRVAKLLYQDSRGYNEGNHQTSIC